MVVREQDIDTATQVRSAAAELRERLKQEGGVAGIIYHIGSDSGPDPNEAFERVVVAEWVRSGIVSWIQGKTPLEDMDVQPNHHPRIGLTYDGRMVRLDESRFLESIDQLETGIDFDRDAAPGWHTLIDRRRELGRIRILKTHVASPSCSAHVLSPEAAACQPLVYRSLAKGHLAHAQELVGPGGVVIISVDDPKFNSVTELHENFETMFGDQFDEVGGLVATETCGVLRAIHGCGQWPVLPVMDTGAVDVVHYDAYKYSIAPLIGKHDVLRGYLQRGGLIAWGGIPQNSENLSSLAEKLDISIRVRSGRDYETMGKELLERIDDATGMMFGMYLSWLNAVAGEARIDAKSLNSQTFISATCGYGSNRWPSLRDFSYALARRVADEAKSL
ncbi:hypothetical protein A2961_03420 [Candidatus Woesebacteria bacterium RIFCSPLOWO2_01_FULL_39_21]|uniref:Uncharacterized protein n=1 Tax=Candidatus Woesebacteria bacterium RIFCSPLOWO2_01_FULL_39_21 TaxID=1802519 RepID=A0A1F8BFQ2_9BACT|nr:MAG: hypothetical protein A2961_03420 [Candidatus Woesebacteria bacterium RIFCSPLOWO2_01_FULL_39_21]